MRLLFEMDFGNYEKHWRVFERHSARAIILREGRAAMVYSQKHGYYKFPGGGIEPGESPREAMLRETAEEAGLRVIPESVREYGLVHRAQQSTSQEKEIFVQDNYYFLCRAWEEEGAQRLDPYEAEEGFQLRWIEPEKAILANRQGCAGVDCAMLEREARVLERLKEEGLFR